MRGLFARRKPVQQWNKAPARHVFTVTHPVPIELSIFTHDDAQYGTLRPIAKCTLLPLSVCPSVYDPVRHMPVLYRTAEYQYSWPGLDTEGPSDIPLVECRPSQVLSS